MGLVVTALSPNGDLSALRTALQGAGFSLDSLSVVDPGDASRSVSSGIAGDDLGTTDSSTGTGVPGITHRPRPSRSYFRDDSVADRLGDLEIPDSQLDNYVEALERGRYVVAYFAHTDTIDRIETLFREANLLNVRRF